jgi:hypothetical protein
MRHAIRFLAALAILACVSSPASAAGWYNTAWTSRISVTVEADSIPGPSNLADFPVFVDLRHVWGYSSWALLGMQYDGGDIVVTDSTGTTKLSRELVGFNRATPKGWFYFKAPTLKHATDTVFYIYWGNPAADEKNSAAVWSSNFQMVAHCVGDTSSVNTDTATQTNVGKTDTTSIGSPAWSYVKTSPSKSVWNNDAITGTTWTLTGWIKSADTAANLIPIGLATTYNGLITANPSGLYYLSIYDGTGRAVLTPPVRDGNWHRIAAIARDSGTDVTIGYVDGENYTTAALTPYSIAANIRFGINITDQAGQAWTGSLSEVHISNVERTAAWIVADANNYTTPQTFYAVGDAEAVPVVVLPATMYGVVGRAMKIEYTQVAEHSPATTSFAYSCASDSGTVDADGWTFTPAGVGTFTVIVTATDSGNGISTADTTTINVVAKDGGTGTYSVLFVGDSLFDQGAVGVDTCLSAGYSAAYFAADGGADIRFIGTQGTAPTVHEGHGGWDWTKYTTSGSGLNPFWDAANSRNDFQNYIADSSLTGPIDYCVISLGGNDLFGLNGAALTDSVWAIWSAKIDAFCNALLSPTYGYPNCKIILPLVSNGGADATVWTSSTYDAEDWAPFERNSNSYRKRMRDRYDAGAFNTNVTVCDIGVPMHRSDDYPDDNYLHPTYPAGHVPMATAIYSHLRALIASSSSGNKRVGHFGIGPIPRGTRVRIGPGRVGPH